METLKILPNVDGRRFGGTSVGFDRISQIRLEHEHLLQFVELVTGRDRADITTATLSRDVDAIQAAASNFKKSPEDAWIQLQEELNGATTPDRRTQVVVGVIGWARAMENR